MKPGGWWPVAIGGVLAITVLANLVLIWAANDRNAAVVEPDYYRKAVAWDSTLAEEANDRALGWRLEADLGPVESGGAALSARLRDRAGAPIEGATVRVTAIHNLEAAHPRTARLDAIPGGGYGARLPLGRAGLWELRFDVVLGARHFTETLRRDAAAAVPASAP